MTLEVHNNSSRSGHSAGALGDRSGHHPAQPDRSRISTPNPDDGLIHRIRELRDLDARQLLILSNLRIVHRVVNSYDDDRIARCDLVGEGTLGLLNAVDAYDPATGIAFRRYAQWWIKQAIRRAVARYQSAIVVPFQVAEQLKAAEEVRQRTFGETGRWLSVEEVAKALFPHCQHWPQMLHAWRLSEPRRPDEPIPASQVVDHGNADDAEARDNIQFARDLLASMDSRKADLLRRRFGLDGQAEASVQEMASQLRLPVERIRRIEKDLLREMADRWR
jgi:RNA polymerase primary sigma factor